MKIPMFALQHGAATGAIIILLKLVGYLLGVEAMMSGWSGFGQMVFVVAGMFVAVAATRNAEEGWITFGRAFGVALLTAAVATLLALLMDIILGTLIDPGLSEKLMRLTRRAGQFRLVDASAKGRYGKIHVGIEMGHATHGAERELVAWPDFLVGRSLDRWGHYEKK